MKIKEILINRSLLLLLLTVFFVTACDNEDDSATSTEIEVVWKTSPTVTYEQGSATILITGEIGTKWTAEVTAGTDWCSFNYSDYSGGGMSTQGVVKEGVNALYLYYSANTGAEKRVAVVAITFEGDESPRTLQLTQVAHGETTLPAFEKWAETPVEKENTNYTYITHYVKLNGKTVRNYSLCFDKAKKAALWVAYPLHKAYIGSVSRSNDWVYDPDIDENYQAYLRRAYKEYPLYDRGHQLPSADRTATSEMNDQTFYFSNQTPQLGTLNQHMWVNLETKVRNYICSDTLYVVTGALFDGNSTATDNNGKLIPVPGHYFKVLLRTVNGNTGKAVSACSASELKTIGFWVEHKSYGNIQPPRSICTSVSDIEQKTGLTFFPTIPEAVKQDYNPADWNIN